MDHAANGLRGSGQPAPGTRIDLGGSEPLDRAGAVTVIEQGDELLEANEPQLALAHYERAANHPDRDVAAAALLGIGNALYRMDRDDEALQAWEAATQQGETPAAYRAWRQVAAGRVRAGDLRGALDAYRQCERRAPREDRPEIASRLGWLSKETGNQGAANRYFARSRGDTLPPWVTYLIIAAAVVISVAAVQPGQAGRQLMGDLELNATKIADGEYWRLLTVSLVHANYFHLFFNMYALWFVGVMVERMYGTVLFGAFYLVCLVAASTASFVFGSGLAVGASGAIFGLFGVALASTRRHHPMLDSQSKAVSGQLVALIAVNLFIGFSGILPIDNAAHVGGLLAGLWLGFLIPPAQVATLATFWQVPGGRRAPASLLALRGLGVLALVVVVGAGIVVGTDAHRRPETPVQGTLGTVSRTAEPAPPGGGPVLLDAR